MISVGFRARILIMTQLAVCMRLKLIDLLFNVIHITPINKASYLHIKIKRGRYDTGYVKTVKPVTTYRKNRYMSYCNFVLRVSISFRSDENRIGQYL